MAGSSRAFLVLLILAIGAGAFEASLTPISADPYASEEADAWRLSLFDPGEDDADTDVHSESTIAIEDFFALNGDPRPTPTEQSGRWERWSAEDLTVPPGSLVDDFLRTCHELRLNCFTPLEPVTRLSRKLHRACRDVAETQAFLGLAPKISEGTVGNARIGRGLGCAVRHSGPINSGPGRANPLDDLHREMLDRGWVEEQEHTWEMPGAVLRRDGAVCSLPPVSEIAIELEATETVIYEIAAHCVREPY
jgi:hypothetical protein